MIGRHGDPGLKENWRYLLQLCCMQQWTPHHEYLFSAQNVHKYI